MKVKGKNREMISGTKAKIAFAAAGVALMTIAGGAVFALTYELAPTLIALLATAVALATVGRRAARAFWEQTMLGIDDPYGEETRSYEDTTRGRHLAPNLLRLVRKAEAPVTIMVVGDEHLPGHDGRCAWSAALHQAATAGATVLLYIREHTDQGEAERAHVFAQSHPHCRAIRIGRTRHGTFDALSPIIAWAGDRNDPADALLWIEDTRVDEETTTCAEHRNARNLRRNRSMLEEYAERVEGSAARGTRATTA